MDTRILTIFIELGTNSEYFLRFLGRNTYVHNTLYINILLYLC